MAIAIMFIILPFTPVGSIFDFIHHESLDMRFLLRGPVKPSGKVVIALVDQKSINAYGRWPWSRSLIARIIETLKESGVKTIGFDVLFPDPEVPHELAQFKKLAESYLTLGLLDESRKSRKFYNKIIEAGKAFDKDALMASKMEEFGNVVLGMAFLPSHEEAEPLSNDLLLKMAYLSFANQDELGIFEPNIFENRTIPVPVLARAAKSMGFVNTDTDTDGALRYEYMVINHDGAFFAPLGLRIVQAYLGLNNEDIVLHFNKKVTIGASDIPIGSNGSALINYYGPAFTFPSYPVADILQGKIPTDKLKDKVVLVGGAVVGFADLWPTPFSPAFYGVEKQATVVENILQNEFLSDPLWVQYFNIAVILFLGLILGITIHRLSNLWAILFSITCLVAYSAAVQIAFVKYRLVLNFTFPALQIIFTYMVIAAYRYFIEERDKRFLKSTFENYLAPEVIDNMYKSKSVPELGGESRNITAYFTDIQEFSSFSEKLTAEQLVDLLNEYLTAMTDILIYEQGCLDKYEGDAILAFFGAPADLPDHSLRAVRTALSMQKRLGELCEKWRNEKQLPDEPNRNTKSLPPEEWTPGAKWPKLVQNMKMRIGINTGEIVVGNMGSTTRMNYTMMGDNVNLAARLENAAKQYGVYSIVSDHTMNMDFTDESGEKKKVMDMIDARYIDKVIVVGKTEPVKIYEVCAMKGKLSKQEKMLFKIFNAAMQHYLNMEWDDAITKFKQSFKIERNPDGKTTPSEVYIQRCKTYKENPPVASKEKWDGVCTLRIK